MDEAMHGSGCRLSEKMDDSAPKNSTSYSIVFVEKDLLNDENLQLASAKLDGSAVFPSFSEDIVTQTLKATEAADSLDTTVKLPQRTIFVTKEFETSLVQRLRKKCWVLGPPAFRRFMDTTRQIPKYNLDRPARPTYNFNMKNIVAYFSGYNKEQRARMDRLVNLIHYMNGKVVEQLTSPGKPFRVTHLISQWVQGENYQTAINLGARVVTDDWIEHLWSRRDETLDAGSSELCLPFNVKPFFRLSVFFLGFDEVASLRHLVETNGGTVVDCAEDATHIVVDSENKPEKIKVTWEELGEQRMVTIAWAGFTETIQITREKQALVSSEWFWTCIKMDKCAHPDAFTLLKSVSSSSSRSADRKRKPAMSPRTPSKKRLSVVAERESALAHASFDHSDESLHSTSSDVLSQPMTKRQQTVEEMLKTETNYIKTLSDILRIKEEAALEQNGKPIYDTEAAYFMDEYMKMIPDILDLHTVIHRELEMLVRPWHEDARVGNVWLKYGSRLESCYPPYVNLIEKLKKHIEDCERRFPKFRAHLLLAQMKSEYGRHHLKDLLVRPVQRLASVDVLLTDIRKATLETNPDYADLTRAKAEVQRVLTFINKKKQAAEVEEMLADIDEAPATITTSHGEYLAHVECFELANRQFHDKGTKLSLILFSDALIVTKRRYDRRFENKPDRKPLKFLDVIPLMRIKKIVDVLDEGELVRGAFVLSFLKDFQDEPVDYKFALTLEYLAEKRKKRDFLILLKGQVLANDCTADPLQLLRDLSADDFDIKHTDTPSTAWDRARKLPRTMSRRLSSIGRSSGQKLKRAVSNASIAFLTPTAGKKAVKSYDDSDSDCTPQRPFNKLL